jgi:hypothetical protein
MIKLLQDARNWEELKLEKEYLQDALNIIMKVASQDPYTLSIILCLVGAIENGKTDALAEACTLYAVKELKAKLDAARPSDDNEDEETGLVN